MFNYKLFEDNIEDLVEISSCDDFPYRIDRQEAAIYCNDCIPTSPCIQTYGVFMDEKLVSVMTATFLFVFPNPDNLTGRIVYISGAYTRPEYRHKGLAKILLQAIEKDAKEFFIADYICCDSYADELYLDSGFEFNNKSRLWKVLQYETRRI